MVIFPDIEKALVSYLDERLSSLELPEASNVRVATKKAPADAPQPEKEVVVTGNYSGNLDAVRANATITIDVYASDYETASTLGLLVSALVVNIPSDPVKRAVVTLGPVRLADEAPYEKRSISVELVVKGSPL